jgi:hypothetical protein
MVALVLGRGKVIAAFDTPVNSSKNATASSERLTVEEVCRLKERHLI